MTRRKKRVSYVAALFALLLVMLALSPDVGSVWVFIVIVGLALAWIDGFTRTPRIVRAALRDAPGRTQDRDVAPAAIEAREYRYPGRPWAVGILGAAAVLMAGLAIVMFVVGPGGVPDRLAMALPPAVLTGLLAYAAWVTPRLMITVGPQGLDSRELAGRVRIPWNEVVCAYASDIYVSGAPFIANLYVYSLDDHITVNSKLCGFQELADLVRRHTRFLDESAEGSP